MNRDDDRGCRPAAEQDAPHAAEAADARSRSVRSRGGVRALHRDALRVERVRHLGLEERHAHDRQRREQRGGCEAGAAALVAVVAGCRVPFDDAHRVRVELLDVGGHEFGPQTAARRCAVAPEHPRAHRAAEPLLHPVHELVGRVAVHADDLGDRGRREIVAQREVEHFAVAVAERVGRRPQQRGDLGVFGDARGIVEARESIFGPRLRPFDHGKLRFVDGSRALLFALAVERAVVGDTQQPPAERVLVVQRGDVVPGRKECVLGDVGRGLAVPQDPVREVVDAVEPVVVKDPERIGIAGAHPLDERGVVGTGGQSAGW